MPVYNNGTSCPAEDSLGNEISEDRNEVLVFTGTDGQTYCFNYDDLKGYVMTDSDFPSGLMYVPELPYPDSLSQAIPQVAAHQPPDPAFLAKLESIVNPGGNAVAFQPPEEFLRLIKRLGQCLYYFNNKGTKENEPSTLTTRIQIRKMNVLNENICRAINFAPYIKAIESYMKGVDESTRNRIHGLVFKGYKGRSHLFNAEIASGNKSPREITFGEYISRVIENEECMGTTASNLINFHNKLQRNRGHPELQVAKELIANANAARFCPSVEYTTNLSREISSVPLFANEGGRRKKTRRNGNGNRKRNRITRSRHCK